MNSLVFNEMSINRTPLLQLKKAKGLQNVKVLVIWGPFYGKKLKKVSQCQKN